MLRMVFLLASLLIAIGGLSSCAPGSLGAGPTVASSPTALPSEGPMSGNERLLHDRLGERYEAAGNLVRDARERLAEVMHRLPSLDADPEEIDELRSLLAPFEEQLAQAAATHSRAKRDADIVSAAVEARRTTAETAAAYERLSGAVTESIFIVLDMTSALRSWTKACKHNEAAPFCDPEFQSLLQPLLELHHTAETTLDT